MRVTIDKISTDLDNLSKGIARPDTKVHRSQSVGRVEGGGAMSNYRARRENMKKGIFQDIDDQMCRFKQGGPDFEDNAPGSGIGMGGGGRGAPNGAHGGGIYDGAPPPLPAQDAAFMADMHRQQQSNSIHQSVEKFYQTGKMNAELAMTIVDLGAEKIAPNLSDEDVDFIMANFDFDQMAGEMRKMREDEKVAAGKVQQRLRAGSQSSQPSNSSGPSLRRSSSRDTIRSSIDSDLSRGRAMFKPSKRW